VAQRLFKFVPRHRFDFVSVEVAHKRGVLRP
jgi:hypothetical protein